MKRFLYELSESWKIAAAQMRSNLTRSTLTALGVIIGIIAVTLMGTAVNGISLGFDKSMAVNQNRIRRDLEPDDRGDPELESGRRSTGIEFDAIREIWR